MRTTLNIRDDLYKEATKATGVSEKTKLVHLGFEALIRDAARRRLMRLSGAIPRAWVPPRRR
ncbi:MAG: type II toxin-antitoxin system VapB family antitoxin, partial [Deltaproteobacteria bacterium]|nr:type II toxin-antitoxin system VapB family antitoxin [Deltaproteobacteria bacterium]